jgi:hypothetical protein
VYRVVDTKFWSDEKVRELSSNAKLLFLYFITNQHTHLSGIYYLPFPVVLYETGLSEAQVKKGIDTLSIPNLAYFDYKTDIVWVVNMLSYQGWGVKIKAAVEKQLQNLHNSYLIQRFHELYEEKIGTLSIPKRPPIDTTSVPVPVLNSSDSSREEEETSKNTIPYTEFQEEWNDAAEAWGLPTLREMTAKRKKLLRKRLESQLFQENWKQALRDIGNFPFLCGENDRRWKAKPDWFLGSDEAIAKILEGFYEGKSDA